MTSCGNISTPMIRQRSSIRGSTSASTTQPRQVSPSWKNRSRELHTALSQKRGIYNNTSESGKTTRIRKDLDLVPGEFHQGAGRPAQTTANLPPRGVHHCQQSEQHHGDLHRFCKYGTSDGGGLHYLHQPDDGELDTVQESGAAS